MNKTRPETERKVSRVLVMLQYDEQHDGEVFDLTALTHELAAKCENRHARIELEVTTTTDYVSTEQPRPLKSEASWNAMVNFHSSGKSGWLDDAINASLPDSFATADLRKKLSRVQKKAEDLSKDIQAQRMLDAASVRHQHPIARLSHNPLADVPPAQLTT